MNSEDQCTNLQTPGLEVQKKRKWRKRGKQNRKSEDVGNGTSDPNLVEAYVDDNANDEENLVLIINDKCKLDENPLITNTDANSECFETVDALVTQNSIEIETTQRQISESNNDDLLEQEYFRHKNLIADNNNTIFTDGTPFSCLKKSTSVSSAAGKAINELSSKDVEKLYPSTPDATEPELVQHYNSKALPKEALTYQLEKFARNVLIIFNQKKFADESVRLGTDKDVEALTDTFGALDFDVLPYTNRTLTQIKQILEAVANQDFTDYGCVAIAVLTHGSLDGEIWAKDESYSEFEIINCLKTHKNHSLITKPRILMVQACRGPNALAGVPVLRKGKTRTDLKYDTKPYTLPVEADMVVLHSSYAGNQAHRDELAGTWFIQTLCKKINELAATHDLESILTHVKHEVAIDKEHEVYNRVTGDIDTNKQMPVVTTTLIRKLYLRKYGDEEDYTASIINEMESNIGVDSANVVNIPLSCACALNYYDYIKDCLRHYVKDNSEDSTARSLLVLTETFRNEEVFKSVKEKCAVAIADHLEQNAKNFEYYKFLHIYKRF